MASSNAVTNIKDQLAELKQVSESDRDLMILITTAEQNPNILQRLEERSMMLHQSISNYTDTTEIKKRRTRRNGFQLAQKPQYVLDGTQSQIIDKIIRHAKGIRDHRKERLCLANASNINDDAICRLHLSGLDQYTANIDLIKEYLKPFGVNNVFLPRSPDQYTSWSSFCFVTFDCVEGLAAALRSSSLSPMSLLGRPIRLSLPKSTENDTIELLRSAHLDVVLTNPSALINEPRLDKYPLSLDPNYNSNNTSANSTTTTTTNDSNTMGISSSSSSSSSSSTTGLFNPSSSCYLVIANMFGQSDIDELSQDELKEEVKMGCEQYGTIVSISISPTLVNNYYPICIQYATAEQVATAYNNLKTKAFDGRSLIMNPGNGHF